ncbi:RcnB family protein [Sphingomonas lenta]|uniref:ATP-dependent RNA helicase n=1 Tax=Sphingomonas lenta TaxID=1141887 RepID=A0A2A2SG96_9SPHN|nr:RcnB family protein [Sphingomonas lenta]PAX08286.1 hypothetical protein CKY28_12080 [Sphingomonas lenta]
MRKLLLGLVIAAAALTPMLAHAQEQPLIVPDDVADAPRERPSREERQERRAERAERRAERAGSAEPVVQRPRANDRPGRRFDGDGVEEARPNGMFRRRDGQVFPPTPEQRREARQERREDRQERREDRRGRREAGAGAIGADWLEGGLGRRAERDDRFERRDERLERREERLERRADRRDRLSRRGGWFGDDDGFAWDRGGYHDGRVWNRGWRDDRRYDWNAYRQYNQGLYRLPRYYPPYGYRYDYRRFGLGTTLSRSLFAPSYWIDDPWAYRLPPAYGPYRWVRYYDDALLIDLRTGRVVDMVYGIFY